MKLRMKTILFGFFVILSAAAYADVTQESGQVLIQHVSAPELSVFCNQTSATVFMQRVAFDNPGVQAGWSSELPAHCCSVFLADKSPFVFSCSEQSSSGLSLIDCKKDLLVGPLTWNGKMLTQEPTSGSYWVAEAISVDDVPLVVRHKGFDL